MSKSRLSLIIILALCMLACLFAGCSIGTGTYDELLEEYGITAQVTYYGNGGYFNQNSTVLSMEVEYTTGSKFYNVTTGSSVYNVSRSNYELIGWYYVQTRTITEENANGEDEEVLYFVLDVTDDYVEENFAHTDEKGNVVYYFEYTSELTTGTEDEDDEEETNSSSSGSSSSDEDEFEDDEIDYSNLTQYMYFVKVEGEWLMSQEDYDYYIRIRKQNSSDNSIVVPDVKFGNAVDTSMIVEDGTHLYVVADWVKSVSINYVLVMKEGETATSITVGGETVNVGEVIYQEYFGTSTSITRSDASGLPSSVKLTDATVLAFYYDEECTQPVGGLAISKPDEDEYGNIPDVTIYAQCVSGVYTVVRNAGDVASMFSSGSSNYYIYNDIDCDGTAISPMAALSGEIRGNGYKLSNLEVTTSSLGNNTTASLFGNIISGAKITDLTIDTVDITYTTKAVQFVNIYLVGMAGQGAKNGDFDITGLTLRNVTLTVTLATYSGNQDGYTIINNIQYQSSGGTYESDNWLYGTIDAYYTDNGVSETDAEFITTFGGATIEGATLYIQAGTDGEVVKVAEI